MRHLGAQSVLPGQHTGHEPDGAEDEQRPGPAGRPYGDEEGQRGGAAEPDDSPQHLLDPEVMDGHRQGGPLEPAPDGGAPAELALE